MKNIFLILTVMLLLSCKKEPVELTRPEAADTAIVAGDTLTGRSITDYPEAVKYSNDRFRNVKAVRGDGNNFIISGEAQIFEASFGWVIEDGHNELKSGHSMTDAGAPEWGKFEFTVDATKEQDNSTLNLILFELSAKDGSRQHELPVLLW